jgi:hypothetical protein
MPNETISSSLDSTGLGHDNPNAIEFREGEGPLKDIPSVYMVPKGSGPTTRVFRYGAFTVPAGTSTEGTGVIPNVEVTTTETEFTSGVVGAVLDVSMEAIMDSKIPNLPTGAARAAQRAIEKRALIDLMATVTALTAVSGAAGNIPNMAALAAAFALFEAQCSPNGAPTAIILHPGSYSRLMQDMMVSAATSIALSGSAVAGQYAPSRSRGTIFGASVIVTDAVAASTTGRSNCIIPIGDGVSPLGLAVWMPVSAIPLGKTERFTDRTLVAARYGVACVDPSAGVEFICDD